MKHFVTLFPPAQNVHLAKDVGQIPYHMHRCYGYTSTLVCYKNSSAYPYLNKEVKGLNIEFMENTGSMLFWERGVIRYLLKHSRSIDVLNVYHLSQASMLYGLMYTWLNPKGILYLKLDFNLGCYRKEGFQFSNHPLKEKFHQFLYRLFLRKVGIVSVETREAEQILKKREPRLKNKLLYIPNGVDGRFFDNAEPGIDEKENIILTVGRIGVAEKNHGVFLEALSTTNLQNWKVLFVGPVLESFKPVIDAFYSHHPERKDQVQFIGNITNREELYTYYRRAKVFCLPSKSEGFPLVLAEALQFGNYIVGTDTITSIKEITMEGEIGCIIPADNSEALSKALVKITDENFYNTFLKRKILKHAANYRWENILYGINHQLNKMGEQDG